MPRPAPQPAMRKAPRKEHPYAPEPSAEPLRSVPEPDQAPRTASPEPAAADSKVFSTRLETALIRRVKVAAAEQGISVQDLVTEAITKHLAD